MTPEEAYQNYESKIKKHREFLNYVRPGSWEVDDEHELWFRGEAKHYKDTYPTMIRELFNNGDRMQAHLDFNYYQMWLYTKTRKFLYEHHKNIFDDFRDSWDYPFFMQHYGIPTNFIDFTPDLKTALYFATKNIDKLPVGYKEKDLPVLILFDPSTFNYLVKNKTEKDPTAYLRGAAKNGDFYDFMVFGGEWQENGDFGEVTHNARELKGNIEFVKGMSTAISPQSEVRISNKKNTRMYSQRGYFFYGEYWMFNLEKNIEKAYREEGKPYPNEYLEYMKLRLYHKISMSFEEAKLIKSYLEEEGYNDKYFGLDIDLEGFNNEDFTYKTYLLETNGGFKFNTNSEEFISNYIAPLEIWHDSEV